MAHGFFHLDVPAFGGAVQYRIFAPDLSQALTFAIDDLEANWRVYKRRFQGGG